MLVRADRKKQREDRTPPKSLWIMIDQPLQFWLHGNCGYPAAWLQLHLDYCVSRAWSKPLIQCKGGFKSIAWVLAQHCQAFLQWWRFLWKTSHTGPPGETLVDPWSKCLHNGERSIMKEKSGPSCWEVSEVETGVLQLIPSLYLCLSAF